jgi:hypothetical protein
MTFTSLKNWMLSGYTEIAALVTQTELQNVGKADTVEFFEFLQLMNDNRQSWSSKGVKRNKVMTVKKTEPF